MSTTEAHDFFQDDCAHPVTFDVTKLISKIDAGLLTGGTLVKCKYYKKMINGSPVCSNPTHAACTHPYCDTCKDALAAEQCFWLSADNNDCFHTTHVGNHDCSDCEDFKAKGEAPITEEGKKYDTNKQRWDLLPLSLVSRCVDVLTFGATKYGPNNWQSVENGMERYYAALMRHITAWRNGEPVDVETRLSHLAHAMCNLVFLDYLEGKK